MAVSTKIPRLLTQAEVAEILRVTVKTVQRLRANGELAFLPGSPVLIMEDELYRYIKRKQVRLPRPPPKISVPTRREMSARARGRQIGLELRASGYRLPTGFWLNNPDLKRR